MSTRRSVSTTSDSQRGDLEQRLQLDGWTERDVAKVLEIERPLSVEFLYRDGKKCGVRLLEDKIARGDFYLDTPVQSSYPTPLTIREWLLYQMQDITQELSWPHRRAKMRRQQIEKERAPSYHKDDLEAAPALNEEVSQEPIPVGEPESTLGRLTLVLAQAEELKAQADGIVQEARSEGISWSQIARAANITVQAAHQRWSEGGVEKHREAQRRRRSQ